MDIFSQSKRLLVCMVSLLLAVILWSCRPGHCFIGSEITIPSTDSSAPVIVGIDFIMPDGTIVSRVPGDGLSAGITVPTNGDVTVNVVVRDAQGVRDAQIFAGIKRCTFDLELDLASCSGPGLLGAPTASNPELNSAGQPGCTERLVTQTINITETATCSRSAEISAKGLNFGGQQIVTTLYTLSR